jgi:2-aminoadipate transaminase
VHVDLDRQSKIPIYLQLKRHLERLISKGTFPVGHKLPASRELALELGLNRGTVINAYAELEAEGLVRSHIGQGTFVSSAPGGRAEEPLRVPGEVTPRSKVWRGVFAKRVGKMENREEAFPFVNIKEGAISFASGTPDQRLFPIQEFGRAMSAALRKHGGEVLQYGSAQGYLPLRQWVSARLTRFGIETEPEEVTIVSGSQQALDLVGRVLLDPEDLVIVEDPTYFGGLNAFNAHQATYLSVRRDAEGLDLRALENILAQHRPKFLYVIPAFHYPTGYCLDAKGRRGLMDLLERHPLPFVEDDFCANLRYEGAIEPALKSIDRLGLGIYIGTFSKSLFPGLRIGWVVAPREVTERLAEAKQACDLRSGVLAQAAVYEFCKRGGYDRHLKFVRQAYRHRRDVALAALERHLPAESRWVRPAGGLSIWVTLPREVDTRELLAETAASGVLFAPGTLFSPFGGAENSMRLCFAPLDPSSIEKGIAVIGRAVKKRLRRSRPASGIGARESLGLP